jgi:protein ImuA
MASCDLDMLRREIIRLEEARRGGSRETVSTGCGPLDELLPERGMRRGTLAEWLAVGDGTGSSTLALLCAREACRDGGTLIVLDSRREFYPPSAVRLGIALEQLIVVRAGDAAENLWALDQALRCRAVAAVLAWPDKLDGRVFRRLQLAAEEGGGLGLLIRPDAARYAPSWADVRVLVEPLPSTSPRNARRRLRACLLRCRGGTEGRSMDLEIDDETHSVHLAARLAEPMSNHRAVGAFGAIRKWGA